MASSTLAHHEQIEFFKLGGTYSIDAENTPEDLMNDANCLLDSAIGVLHSDFEKLDSNHWAALYLMQQAKAMHNRATELLTKGGAFKKDQ